jgi:hypothetical protein
MKHIAAIIDCIVGWASHKYTPAKAKPSGTRVRRAIFCQLAIRNLEQLPGCAENILGCDLQQTGIGISRV